MGVGNLACVNTDDISRHYSARILHRIMLYFEFLTGIEVMQHFGFFKKRLSDLTEWDDGFR